MPNLQTQFNKFHEKIKIDFEGNAPLREKRDLILSNLRDGLKNLRDGLKRQFSYGAPTFSDFNQGSYDLSTGVEPLEGEDYDIDVGVVFNFSRDKYQPVQVKEWVYSALNSVANRTVEIKRPCVRVQYHKSGEKHYHVDLAIYCSEKYYFGNETLYIAKGYSGSSADKKIWEVSEPKKLKEFLKEKCSDNSDREQFRRVIRYLKRWKDVNFSSSGSARPTGIALTACCYNLFTPKKDNSYISYDLKYNDMEALRSVVSGIIAMFDWQGKISVKLPVKPNNDLFEKMSVNQMAEMKGKLIILQTILRNSSDDYSSVSACAELRKAFGNDFPEA